MFHVHIPPYLSTYAIISSYLRLRNPFFSGYHSSRHSSSCAEHKSRHKMYAVAAQRMIYSQSNQKEQNEISTAKPQPPEKSSDLCKFSNDDPAHQCRQDIDSDHCRRYALFIQFQPVQGHSQKQKQDSRDHISCKERLEHPQDPGVFSNFSLHIRPKEKLALVGLNGAGKTTLIKLICGLYKPTKGEILINGINLNDFKIEDYYKKISLVAQEIEPLAFTIKDNIVLGSKYNEKKLQSVIKESGLDNVVDRLKNKENTYLTQNFSLDGVELSGGESQKLLLARALYKDSYFIALDEPTSALDPLAESELYLKYEELIKNRTSIYVSHRLSSTKFCDRIVYIENGEIVEEGTHEELMKKKGEYYKLFSLQAKYYKEDSKNV